MDALPFTPQHFGWRVEARVATLTLERVGRKNALTFESYAELGQVFRALAQMTEIRAVILTGAGGDFCSGGDVYDIIGPLLAMSGPERLAFTRMTGEVVKAMRACPLPVLAAIDGVCAGAGAILAMAADLRLATPEARIAFLFTRVGLAGCDMGASAMLPRIIGQGRAAELLLTGRAMDAEQALSWGFLNRISAKDALMAETRDLARRLADGPSFAHAMTKAMLHQAWSVDLDRAIDMDAQAQAICMGTQDFRRAYDAFEAKTRPIFEGD
jgi:enoyl-CoA hydratase/carnithine racemase